MAKVGRRNFHLYALKFDFPGGGQLLLIGPTTPLFARENSIGLDLLLRPPNCLWRGTTERIGAKLLPFTLMTTIEEAVSVHEKLTRLWTTFRQRAASAVWTVKSIALLRSCGACTNP